MTRASLLRSIAVDRDRQSFGVILMITNTAVDLCAADPTPVTRPALVHADFPDPAVTTDTEYALRMRSAVLAKTSEAGSSPMHRMFFSPDGKRGAANPIKYTWST